LCIPCCSLGGQFTPLTAYIPTGPDALPTHVFADPIEMTKKELNGVDPFVDMVIPYSFKISSVWILI
jgi:hypothetical protein